MTKFIVLSVFVLLTNGFAFAQIGNRCPISVRPADNFNIERFSGKEWYTIDFAVGNASLIRPPSGKCEGESFTSTVDPNIYRVNVNGIEIPSGKNISDSVLVIIDPSQPAIMPVKDFEGDTTAILLGTDYESWSLFFRCTIVDNTPYEFAVIRSRARTLDPSVHAFLRSWVLGLGFLESNIVQDPQTDC